jgi:hypothetical protein
MKLRNLLAVTLAALLITACAGSSMSVADREAAKTRLTKAEAMFQERCKTVGVFIHRTAENVEAVFLLKLRPDDINRGDQYRMDDPYGRDFGGDAYIRSFLWARNEKGLLVERENGITNGYRYVDAIDPKDGKRYRYTGSVKAVGKQDTTAHNVRLFMSRDPNYDLNIYRFVSERILAPDPAPRYGITYDDLSTREDRDYWIAGSSLKVIDLKTNEVMAERIGYMMDRGQGSDSGGRSPWLFAADHACPVFSPRNGSFFQARQTRNFVEKVLHTVQEK